MTRRGDIMKKFIVVFISGIILGASGTSNCQSIAALSINGEQDLMRVIESGHKDQLNRQFREFLAGSSIQIEIVDMDIETRVSPSKDENGSYDINVYYVDPTEEGCSQRVVQIALFGAALAHSSGNAEIGTVTAIPVFPSSAEKGKKKMRGIVVINYWSPERRGLIERIANGKLKADDIHEMNAWQRTWKEVRLDPHYSADVKFK